MTCAKCHRQIDDNRTRVALILGDGRGALDCPCFERMLQPGRAAMLMRPLREATIALRQNGAGVESDSK
jgi:hypothetical protein